MKVREKMSSGGSSQGERNIFMVELLKTLLESLMNHVMTRGADIDEDKARLLLQLFRRHKELAALLKGTGGGGGAKGAAAGGAKKKKDKNESQQLAKKGAPAKHRAGAFAMPEHAYTLRAINVLFRAVLL